MSVINSSEISKEEIKQKEELIANLKQQNKELKKREFNKRYFYICYRS